MLDTPLLLPGSAECDAALVAARLDLLASTGKELSKVIKPTAGTDVIKPEPTKIYQQHKADQIFREMYPDKGEFNEDQFF